MHPRAIGLLVMLALLGATGGIPGAVGTDTTDEDKKEPTTISDVAAENEMVTKKPVEREDEGENPSGSKLVASEVVDMMQDPYHPSAPDSEDEKEKTIDSDTVVVSDSHVIAGNKTHESEVTSTPEAPALILESVSTSSPANFTIVPQTSLDTANQSQTSSTSVNANETPSRSNKVEKSAEILVPPPENVNASETYNSITSTGLSSVGLASMGRSALSAPTEVAAILAFVLVVSAIAGYVGMLSWRRFLEKRYGNREMLVNEDDDLRHFEL